MHIVLKPKRISNIRKFGKHKNQKNANKTPIMFFFLVCVILAQILAHGLQLSFGAIEPFVSWRYKVSVTDTGRKTEIFLIFLKHFFSLFH